MYVSAKHRIAAPPETVYTLFTDREALLQATPGLEKLEELEPDHHLATVKVGIGGFALVWQGTLTVTDRRPGEGYRLHIHVKTHNGYARGDADFRFLPSPDGGTEVQCEADVEMGGAQKLLPSLARGLVDFFLRGMNEVITERLHPESRGLETV